MVFIEIAEGILTVVFLFLIVLHISWIAILLKKNKEKEHDFSPDISIIIPCHNEEKNIESTVNAVLSQKYRGKKEIIIVDDGSTDQTGNKISLIVKKNKAVKFIKTNHNGKAAALNKAVKKAKYGIFVIVDGDSALSKNSLSELVKPLSEKDIGGTSGIIRAKKNSNPLTWFQDLEYTMTSSWRYVSTKVNANNILPCLMAIKKDALKKIGYFQSDTLTEDFDIAIELRKNGYRTATTKKATAYTTVPNTLYSLFRQRIRWGKGIIQVIRKHRKFIFSNESGLVGKFSIPTQFYWYIHAVIFMPLVIYTMFFWFSGFTLKYFVSWFTIYGAFDLLYNIIVGNYAFRLFLVINLVLFFVSLFYLVLVFTKVTKPDYRNILAYIFFFPYTLLNLFFTISSIIYTLLGPGQRNKWEK